jgi:NADH:ubiquinone oxidoreductase subunit 5 (subunit L)/multisubunit Na+/H+ antiporter MnhA subunit
LYLPLLLIVNCFSIYLFRNKIGSLGIFISSVSTLLYSLSTIVFNLHPLSASPFYTFVDYGRWFFVYDVLDSNLVFIVDNLSTTLTTLVLLLTLFAQVFGIEYMYREAYASRLIYLLNMFATSVVFLFFVYDFFLILVVWELIGLFSLLLVNFYSQRVYTIKAALKTFFFSRISDFFISMSFFIVILLFNSSDLGVVFLQTPYFIFYNTYLFNTGFNTLNLLSLFILFSGAVKAAQFFFHV